MAINEEEVKKVIEQINERRQEFQSEGFSPGYGSYSPSKNLKLILVATGVIIVLIISAVVYFKSLGGKIETNKNYRPAVSFNSS